MTDLILEPVLIRYDGRDADNHELDMADLAESLKGLSRIIGVCANFAATEKYVQHRDALPVKVVVRPADAHCFEMWATVKWLSENPLISTVVGGLFVLLIAYIFKKAAGDREEMKQLRGALDTAIKELGNRDQTVVAKLLETVDKMADALRPAAKQAVTPIGESASTLTISSGGGAAVVVDMADKEAISRDEETEVGKEATYRVLITELDMETGSCKVVIGADGDDRTAAKITDPAFSQADNPYAVSMAAKRRLAVRAKPTLKDGEIEKLFISDLSAARAD